MALKKFLKERAWKLFLRLDSDLPFYYGTLPPFKVIEVKVWADSLPFRCPKVELSAGNPFGQGLGGTSKGPSFPLPIKFFFYSLCSSWLSVLVVPEKEL